MLKSTTTNMKAHVHNGQIVLDEPLTYPDGTRLRVVLDDDAQLSDHELQALHIEMERSLDEVEAGRYVHGDDLLARLRGRAV